jgi:hypothetical protein
MFQNWETPITSMEARKAAQWYGELFAMTSEGKLIITYASLDLLARMTKQIKSWRNLIKCQETIVEGTFAKTKLYGCHKG